MWFLIRSPDECLRSGFIGSFYLMLDNDSSDIIVPTNRFPCGHFDKIISRFGIIAERCLKVQ